MDVSGIRLFGGIGKAVMQGTFAEVRIQPAAPCSKHNNSKQCASCDFSANERSIGANELKQVSNEAMTSSHATIALSSAHCQRTRHFRSADTRGNEARAKAEVGEFLGNLQSNVTRFQKLPNKRNKRKKLESSARLKREVIALSL